MVDNFNDGFDFGQENLKFGKSCKLDLSEPINSAITHLEHQLDDMELSQNSGLDQVFQYEVFQPNSEKSPGLFIVESTPVQKATAEVNISNPMNIEALMKVTSQVEIPFCPFRCRHSHVCISEMYTSDIFRAFCPGQTEPKGT
jgi:hypothetical protein